jgi:deoxyribonuclease IV
MFKNLGVHLPISGGIHKIFEYAKALKINTIQCFTASNRQWSTNGNIKPEELNKYFSAKKSFGKVKIFSHACYLLNLASEKKEIRSKSEESLVAELRRCNELEIDSVVIHPGSSKDRRGGIDRIVESLYRVRESSVSHINILLEVGSGAGNILPGSLEELSDLYKKVFKEDKNIGVVVDTCHVHAFGYDFSKEDIQLEYWSLIEEKIGLGAVKLIHLNDSKIECGGKVDRHENLGKGTIGIDGFRYIMNYSNINNIPKVLETPYNNIIDYKDELDMLENV